MNSEKFIEKAKQIVKDYTIENMSKGKDIIEFEVAIVWHAYILGNQKALITTDIKDGMYYEVTYNKTTNEIYFDAYKKWENRCIKIEEE